MKSGEHYLISDGSSEKTAESYVWALRMLLEILFL